MTLNIARERRTGTSQRLRNTTGQDPGMRSHGMAIAAAATQAGRTLAGAIQAGRTLDGVTAQQAAVRSLRLARTPVRWTAAGLNRGVIKALSEAQNEEARRGMRAAAAVKACHLPAPAAVAAGAEEAA
jgi:hypothetical protein